MRVPGDPPAFEASEPPTDSSIPDDWVTACESRSAIRFARLSRSAILFARLLSPASARSLASDDSRELDAALSSRVPLSSHPMSIMAEVAKAIDTRSGLIMCSVG